MKGLRPGIAWPIIQNYHEIGLDENMAFGTVDLPDNLKRIISLNGTDEGFYVLALHSLIEGYANSQSPYIASLDRFGEKMNIFFSDLGLCDPDTGGVPPLAKRLTQEHAATNRVRHDFQELSAEEARTATFNFLQFCGAIGWEHQLLADLEEALTLWRGKKTPIEQYREMRKLRLDFNKLREEKQEVEKEVASSRDTRAALDEIKEQLKLKDQELSQLKLTSTGRKEKSSQLRQKLRNLEDEKAELLERAQRLHSAELYVSYLERFTAYTRSRADYERTVLQLSPEQKKAAERIGETGDYLVHGAAGTGKTFVLLHALDQELLRRDQDLGLTETDPLALLTYTQTLVRFDEYLTAVVGKHRTKPLISTVDAFIVQVAKKRDPRFHMDYLALRQFTESNKLSFLSPEELHTEIEEVVFGRALSHENYVDSAGARRGMKQPLSQSQRADVWKLSERARNSLLQRFKLSKNLSRLYLFEALESDAAFRDGASLDRLFVDEVQDLAPVELMTLNLLSRKGLVLAGDEQQAIYQAGMSFRRLGIEVVGHSTALTTNYRNTRQIATFARIFQAVRLADGGDLQIPEEDAYREGPTPELWTHKQPEDGEKALVKRVEFFINVLGYDPENITVLAPFDKQVEEISGLLMEAGYPTQDIRKKEFDFKSTRGVRVSTLHSAKGVEFPVVMLHIPVLAKPKSMAPKAVMEHNFNLVYVALTRAMDNLQLFLPNDSDDEVINLLKQAHKLLIQRERSEDERVVEGVQPEEELV